MVDGRGEISEVKGVCQLQANNQIFFRSFNLVEVKNLERGMQHSLSLFKGRIVLVKTGEE